MGYEFKKVVPKIPLFKRNTYVIPDSYYQKYNDIGITDWDEQTALFHLTQFGGFRLKKIPRYFMGKKEFFSQWFNSKQEKGYFHLKASPEFISKFGDIKIQPIEREEYSFTTYDNKFLIKNNIEISESREIENFLKELNYFYQKVKVNLGTPQSGISAQDRIDLSRFNSTPHFQYKPLAGNRLYHSGPGSSYQRISSNLRPFLTINGRETTEMDISASTIQFMNIVLEKHSGNAPLSKLFLSKGDPYSYFLDKINSEEFLRKYRQPHKLRRDELKDIVYTLIYSPLSSQKRNVNRHLKINGQNYFYEDFKSEFPEFMLAIEELKSISPIINNNHVDEKNSAYKLIFREESKYLREVLKRSCLQQGIPVLPIHDSFVAPKENASELEKILIETSEEFYDYILNYKVKF